MKGMGALIVFVTLAPFAHAQVINGESTYEDNYYHKPPPPEPAATQSSPQNRPAAAKASPPASEAPSTEAMPY